jgi:hypothetical protein
MGLAPFRDRKVRLRSGRAPGPCAVYLRVDFVTKSLTTAVCADRFSDPWPYTHLSAKRNRRTTLLALLPEGGQTRYDLEVAEDEIGRGPCADDLFPAELPRIVAGKRTRGIRQRSALAPHYTWAPQPGIPSSWNDWTFWQYTNKGSVDGIIGDVDHTRFKGNLDG